MDKRCWMLIFSAVVSIPSVAGMACEGKEKRAQEKAAFAAFGAMRADGTATELTNAGIDGLVESTGSPELKQFAEDAKARAESDADPSALTR